MKSTKALKNVRLFKNTMNGKPKRVRTVTDDYGNRVHVVKNKVRPVLSKLGKAKKNYRVARSQEAPPKSGLIDRKTERHYDSIRAREKLIAIHKKKNNGRVSKKPYDKLHYHSNRAHTRIRQAMDKYEN